MLWGLNAVQEGGKLESSVKGTFACIKRETATGAEQGEKLLGSRLV